MITNPQNPSGLGSSPLANPILSEIDNAHASLSPDAQAAIGRAHGLLGIQPPSSGAAITSATASAPELAMDGGIKPPQKQQGLSSPATASAYAKPGPYTSSLSPEEEQNFNSWVKSDKIPFDNSPSSDYDMRGYWRAQQLGDKNAVTQPSAFDGKPHFPDTYKTPYHKTFSNESIYATADAPHWDGSRLIGKDGAVVADETVSGGGIKAPVMGLPGAPDAATGQPEQPLPLRGIAAPQLSPHIRTAHQQNLDRLTATPLPSDDPNAHTRLDTGRSGIDQIHSPFGRVPLQILDAVGRGFFPGFEMALPGTQGHHDVLVNQAGKAVNQEEAEVTAETKRKQEEAATGETEARTKEIGAQTHNIEQNMPKDAFELWFRQNPGKTLADYERDVASGKTPSSAFDLWVKGNPGKGYADFQKDQAANKTPTSAFELWLSKNPEGKYEDFEKAQQSITSKPLNKEHADSLNQAWSGLVNKYHLPTNQFREGMTSAEANDLVKSFNDVVGKAQGAQNIVIHQQGADNAANNRRDATTEKEYTARSNDLRKEFSTVNTQVENIQQARAEINSNPVGQALGTIKTLVSLAGGRGSGVRITQAELDSIAKARGIVGSFEGWVNQLSGKGKLGGDQVSQINDILGEVEKKAAEKQDRLNSALDRLNGAKSVEEIRKIEQEYRHAGDTARTGGAVPTVASQAEYDKLPSGATYMEDGKQYRKP